MLLAYVFASLCMLITFMICVVASEHSWQCDKHVGLCDAESAHIAVWYALTQGHFRQARELL